MSLILLEALLAGLVFILIVWWTMFSGRKGGELHDDHEDDHGHGHGGRRDTDDKRR